MKLHIRIITGLLLCAASFHPAAAATFSFTAIYVGEQDGPGGASGSTSAGDISGFPDLGLVPGTVVHGQFSYATKPPAPSGIAGRYLGDFISLNLPGMSISIPNTIVSVLPGLHEINGFDFEIAPSAPLALPSFPDITAIVALGLRTDKPDFGPPPPISFNIADYYDAYLRVELSRGEGNYTETYIRIVEIETLQTPVPAALPLFATGLGVLGLAAWRHRRKAASG